MCHGGYSPGHGSHWHITRGGYRYRWDFSIIAPLIQPRGFIHLVSKSLNNPTEEMSAKERVRPLRQRSSGPNLAVQRRGADALPRLQIHPLHGLSGLR